jgi:hypothetical protein
MDRPGALGPPWTDAGADNGHGGALTGAQLPAAPVCQSSSAVLSERVAQAGREGSVSGERCSELWGGCSPFIGAGGAAGRGGQGG